MKILLRCVVHIATVPCASTDSTWTTGQPTTLNIFPAKTQKGAGPASISRESTRFPIALSNNLVPWLEGAPSGCFRLNRKCWVSGSRWPFSGVFEKVRLENLGKIPGGQRRRRLPSRMTDLADSRGPETSGTHGLGYPQGCPRSGLRFGGSTLNTIH